MIKNIVTTGALLALLAGCAGKVEQYRVFDASAWQANGKIGIKYPRCDRAGTCQSEAVNAGYRWTHNTVVNYLQLFDPTGQEQLALTYKQGQVSIKENGEERTITTQELTNRLGVALPLAQLSNWLTTQQAETKWQSDGWSVAVDDWQGHFYRNMTLTQGDYRIRLVTYQVKPI